MRVPQQTSSVLNCRVLPRFGAEVRQKCRFKKSNSHTIFGRCSHLVTKSNCPVTPKIFKGNHRIRAYDEGNAEKRQCSARKKRNPDDRRVARGGLISH